MLISITDYPTGVLVINALKGLKEIFFNDARGGGGNLNVHAILSDGIAVNITTMQSTPTFSLDFPHAIDLTPQDIAVSG